MRLLERSVRTPARWVRKTSSLFSIQAILRVRSRCGQTSRSWRAVGLTSTVCPTNFRRVTNGEYNRTKTVLEMKLQNGKSFFPGKHCPSRGGYTGSLILVMQKYRTKFTGRKILPAF